MVFSLMQGGWLRNFDFSICVSPPLLLSAGGRLSVIYYFCGAERREELGDPPRDPQTP